MNDRMEDTKNEQIDQVDVTVTCVCGRTVQFSDCGKVEKKCECGKRWELYLNLWDGER